MRKGYIALFIIIGMLTGTTSVFAEIKFSEKLLVAEGFSPPEADNLSTKPQIAVGSNNIIYIVWEMSEQDGDNGIFFSRSLDGGKSFEEKQEIDAVTLGSDPGTLSSVPRIVVDSNGTVYIVHLRYFPEDEQTSLILSTSNDDGAHFDTRTMYTEKLDNCSYLSDIKIMDNDICVVVCNFLIKIIDGEDSSDLIEISKDDSGNNPMSTNFNVHTYLTTDSNNNLYAVWMGGNDIEYNESLGLTKRLYNIHSAKLAHGQSHFSDHQMVLKCDINGTSLTPPLIATRSNNEVILFWNITGSEFTDLLIDYPIYSAISKDGGKSFSKPQGITLNPKDFDPEEDVGNRIINVMVTDQKDMVHVIYHFGIGASGGMGVTGDLYYSTSKDAGKSFEPGILISGSATAEIAAGADICLSEGDKDVYVVWSQFKEIESTPEGIYFSQSVEADSTDSENNSKEKPKPVTSSASSGGGGGGCFINSLSID